mmetsp:Transcript_4129/g.16944  ORF Transcript_4129/g.16944 Transcript_4129/m.16944 type:complete len:339 (+) Transcript_4129:505-1521(+)
MPTQLLHEDGVLVGQEEADTHLPSGEGGSGVDAHVALGAQVRVTRAQNLTAKGIQVQHDNLVALFSTSECNVPVATVVGDVLEAVQEERLTREDTGDASQQAALKASDGSHVGGHVAHRTGLRAHLLASLEVNLHHLRVGAQDPHTRGQVLVRVGRDVLLVRGRGLDVEFPLDQTAGELLLPDLECGVEIAVRPLEEVVHRENNRDNGGEAHRDGDEQAPADADGGQAPEGAQVGCLTDEDAVRREGRAQEDPPDALDATADKKVVRLRVRIFKVPLVVEVVAATSASKPAAVALAAAAARLGLEIAAGVRVVYEHARAEDGHRAHGNIRDRLRGDRG